jgi:hypothetical protein
LILQSNGTFWVRLFITHHHLKFFYHLIVIFRLLLCPENPKLYAGLKHTEGDKIPLS